MDKLLIGTMGWSYDFWKGIFNPKDTKSEEFLSEYARHFDTVRVFQQELFWLSSRGCAEIISTFLLIVTVL